MRRFPVFVALIGALVFHACAPGYRIVEFEVLEPATVSLPESVQNLIVLNRAPLSTSVFDEKDVRGINKSQLYVLDTMIIRSMFRGLLKVLKQSPIESFHRPIFVDQRRSTTLWLDDLDLTKREVNELCREHGGDAILSLEYYSYDLGARDIRYENSPGTVASKYYESASMVKWNIYLPGSPRSFDKYFMRDTLFFTEVEKGLPVANVSPQMMVRETFFESGRKYGSYLVPLWSLTARPLFRTGDPGMRKAARMTSSGNWDSAYVYWEQLAAEKDSSVRCMALHNMAVYHELEDNLDMSSTMVHRALEYDTLEVVRDYAEVMEVRVQNRNELYKQVR